VRAGLRLVKSKDVMMADSEERRRRATVRPKAQLTLPSEVRDALHVGEGDEVEFTITDAGQVLLRGMTSVPTDQRWFWEPEWQAGEREASEQIKAGDVEVFEDIDAMFASLNE
jgi:AbrB family looped-hinge helix DNA binding protein